ncbi:MAG TPA: hypothetical protein VFB79_00205 [Candidatus Angelobacter sp.]|nr:hypothetical protein [Candidatus Angelobacter sp.]
MKIQAGALAFVMALGCFGTASAVAQDRDRHDEQVQDHHDRDESAYYSNKYYKMGWEDGQHHKRKDHKWKNDADRQAYEAGYMHGDHGEQWKDHDHDRDRDHHQ